MTSSEQAEVIRLFNLLKRADLHAFPASGRPVAPASHGVYAIYSTGEDVLHVGRTVRGRKGLRQRLGNHLTGTSSFRNQFLRPAAIDLRAGYGYRYILVEDPRLRALLEAFAIGSMCPAHIGLSAATGTVTSDKSSG